VYEMYPSDWGPSHHQENPSAAEHSGGHGTAAVQSALDLRDNGGPRPDDN